MKKKYRVVTEMFIEVDVDEYNEELSEIYEEQYDYDIESVLDNVVEEFNADYSDAIYILHTAVKEYEEV